MENENEIIEKRKKQALNFFKQEKVWVCLILIAALILGIYIRTLPLQDHDQQTIPSLFQFVTGSAFNGRPGLWDVTTNTWTLGPDLDPWLFYRYAKTMIQQGSLPRIDTMRNVPLGFDTTTELQMVSYMIVGTHKLLSLFGNSSIELSGASMPVFLFALTIISFFLFVREIFARKNEKTTRANLIALISTFFMIVIPDFLSRTVAGIPEKESVGFFFMFLAFYFFLKAWKTENFKIACLLGILSGISTALMGLTWGAVVYIYVSISVATLCAFVIDKVDKKGAVVYSLWIIFAYISTILFTNRYSLKGFLISPDTGLSVLILFSVLINLLLWNTKLRHNEKLNKIKLPKTVISLIVSIALMAIFSSLLFGFSFIPNTLKTINQIMFQPVTGRWSMTVAENRQPYFTEWSSSFGPMIGNFPILFWLFFIGSIFLFKKMINKLEKKDSWILTGLYILFFFGLVFSRYSASSIFNGENFLSKSFYYLSALILIGAVIYYYNRYYKENKPGFSEIDYEYVFLFALFFLCLFTARSAVRLIMVLAPIAPIFVSYLAVSFIGSFRKSREDKKTFYGIAMIIVLGLSIYSFWTYYNVIKTQSYYMIPGAYNQQWQKAMQWVRNETPTNSVFAHWWDYGYWLQSIGNRATVTDGGNAIVYWNYLTGRLVLTGDNEKDSLEFLYNHNATHLLVDSSDIGKYGAYSIIGSDQNLDRYSWIPTLTYDQKQTKETANGTIFVYPGGFAVDEDINYNLNGTNVFLPAGKAAVAGIVIEIKNTNNSTDSISFSQPHIVFFYQNQQITLPLKYVYFNKKLITFNDGVNATAKIIAQINPSAQGVQIDKMGALIYISPRVMRGFVGQVYLLNDPFNNFPHFKLVHSELDLYSASIAAQGGNIDEFMYYQGVQGPIKIWQISYTGNEKIKKEYQDTDASKYLSWQL